MPWRWLGAAALLGLVLRLAFGFGYWLDQPLTRDELEYLSLARSLAAGHGFVYDQTMRSGSFVPFGRAPGYPAFLALIGAGDALVASVPPSIKIAQSIVGAAGVLLIGLVGFRLGGTRVSQAAALVAACYPPLVWIAAYALSEALFWPVGVLIAVCYDAAFRARGRAAIRAAAVCGLLTAFAILIRPALLLFLPLAGLGLLTRRQVWPVITMALAVLLVIIPWTVRNYFHHGRLMIVASDGGVTFWTGNHPLAIGEGDMAANPTLKRANQELRARNPGLTEEQMEPIYYQESLDWIRQNPMAWLTLEAKKLFYLVVPIGPSYRVAHSRLYYLASVLSYGALLPMAVVGALLAGRTVWNAPGILLLGASAVVMCLVFFPQERFRIPSIDPALIVLSGAAWIPRRLSTR